MHSSSDHQILISVQGYSLEKILLFLITIPLNIKNNNNNNILAFDYLDILYGLMLPKS